MQNSAAVLLPANHDAKRMVRRDSKTKISINFADTGAVGSGSRASRRKLKSAASKPSSNRPRMADAAITAEDERAHFREVRELIRRREFAHQKRTSPKRRPIPGNPFVRPEIAQYTATRPLSFHAHTHVHDTATESIRDVAMEDASYWSRSGTGNLLARDSSDRSEWIAASCPITNVGYHSVRKPVGRKTGKKKGGGQLKSGSKRFPNIQARFVHGGIMGSYLHMRPGAKVPQTVGPGTYNVSEHYDQMWVDNRWNQKGSPTATTFGRAERVDIALTINGQRRMRSAQEQADADEAAAASYASDDEFDEQAVEQAVDNGHRDGKLGGIDQAELGGSIATDAVASEAGTANPNGDASSEVADSSPTEHDTATLTPSQRPQSQNSRATKARSPRHDSSSPGIFELSNRHWLRKGAAMPKAPLQSPWTIDRDIPGPGAYGKLITPGKDAYRTRPSRQRRPRRVRNQVPSDGTATSHSSQASVIRDDRGFPLQLSSERVALRVGRHRTAGEGIPAHGLVAGVAPTAFR